MAYEQLSTLTDYQMRKIMYVGIKIDSLENTYQMSKTDYQANFDFPSYIYDKKLKVSIVKEMFKGTCITIHITK